MSDLRKPFFNTMCELAEADKSVIVIVGDLGFSFAEEYAQKYPKQFLNAGCIEQSMIGIAAGMARGGLKPYVYSNGIFLIGRAYEQVRDDVCYNKTNVKLIATGAAGFLGFSHNWSKGEEINVLKSLPIKSYFPKNSQELKKAMASKGAAYIRL